MCGMKVSAAPESTAASGTGGRMLQFEMDPRGSTDGKQGPWRARPGVRL